MDEREYQALIKVRKGVEWVAEPVDDVGDILEPHYVRTERDANKLAPTLFASFPAAVAVEVAKVTRIGSDAQGELDRQYHYTARYHRDGLVEVL